MHTRLLALALLKALIAGQHPPVVIVGAAVYWALCVWFGLVMFTHPGGGARQTA